MKILSSAHLWRRGLCQDAKNWQDLWDVLEGSIQPKTSECHRGTFILISTEMINSDFYQSMVQLRHGAQKMLFKHLVWSLCTITHHNLSLCLYTLMAALLCYSASIASASYIHLNGLKKWTNEFTSKSAMSEASKHVNHLMFTFSTMPPLFSPNTSKITSNVT
jgi:hypothetical protein